jgi:ABC-type Fe3+ transport system permease subunit
MPTLRAGLAESSLKPAGIRVRLGPFFPIYLGVWGFLGAFLVVPIGRILAETALALAEGDAPLAVGFGEYLARVTFNSILVAGLAAFASVAFGIPLAFFTTKTLTPGRGIFRVLLALPLITPRSSQPLPPSFCWAEPGLSPSCSGGLGSPN